MLPPDKWLGRQQVYTHRVYNKSLLYKSAGIVPCCNNYLTSQHWKCGYALEDDSWTGEPKEAEISVYTDGSQLEGSTGCDFLILKNGEEWTAQSIHMADHNTVFQAEVTAIREASRWLLQQGCRRKTIRFHSDSQAAIKAH